MTGRKVGCLTLALGIPSSRRVEPSLGPCRTRPLSYCLQMQIESNLNRRGTKARPLVAVVLVSLAMWAVLLTIVMAIV